MPFFGIGPLYVALVCGLTAAGVWASDSGLLESGLVPGLKVPMCVAGVLVGLTLITAGAIGDIIDSLCYGMIWGYAPFMFGKVVDMFFFPIIREGERVIFFSPVFNFADSCVTVGAFYLLLFHWKFFMKDEKK